MGQTTQIKGIVLDQITNEPIPFATIAIYNNTTIIDGTTTAENGIFNLTTKQKYTSIEISFIGYQKKLLFREKVAFPLTIKLIPSTNTLEEVNIVAERTTTQLKIDRKIINLGSDIQNPGTSALEAFDQIAEIQVDLSSGSLNLRGSNNVRLLVNGKPSSLSATEILEQLPSSSIQRVELITTPSVKHQADGISGIINIILNKNQSKGINLNLNTSLGTKRYGYGFDGNYNFSSINLRLNASQTGRRMNSKQTLHRRYADNSFESITTPHDFNGLIRKINMGIDFFISTNDALSVQFDYTNDYHSFYNNSTFFDVSDRDNYTYLRSSSHEHLTNIFNINYRKQFSNELHFLEIDLNNNSSRNEYPAYDREDNLFLFEQLLKENLKLSSLSFDYSLPISQNITLETGASLNRSLFASSNTTNAQLRTIPKTHFDYDESIVGIYTLVKTNIEKVNFQAGLRYEYFNSQSNSTINSEKLKLQFKNLFPSIHLSYSPNKTNTINLGYNKRISRPDIRNINPFQLGNPYFRFVGNPNLEPEYSDNLESSYLYKRNKLNIGFSLFYRNLKNKIQRFNSIEGIVQIASFKNIGKYDVLGIEFNSNLNIYSFWNASISANYYHTNIKNAQQLTWSQIYSSNFQLKNTFTINKKLGIDISYRHTPKKQEPFFFILPRNRIDFALRAKFLKNRLVGNLRIVDVLNRNLMKRFTVTQDFSQDEVWRFQTQTFGILGSIKYTLVKNTEKKRKRKKRTYIHENDIN